MGFPCRAVAHVGLRGQPDHVLFNQAFEADEIFVTANAEDFLDLAAKCELHPCLILLREGELSKEGQFDRILAALNAASALDSWVNTVVDVYSSVEIEILVIPSG